MSEQENDNAARGVFDLERIRTLIELMREHELAEMDLRQGKERIRLSRAQPAPAVDVTRMAPAAPPPAALPPPAPREDAAAADGPNIVYIRSPMVGTFYSRANPNAEPFVKVGDHVEADKTVCIIEAMKIFNEIP